MLRESAAEWESPTPFHEADLPEFPVDALPSWLCEWVKAEAETTQTPIDLAAVLGLGAVAAVSARKVRVNPQPGWYEPVNLFTVSVLPPGSQTTVFADATAAIEEYEAELASRVKQDIDGAELSRRTLEAELQKLIKIAAGAVGDDRLVADVDVQDVGMRLAKIVVPELPRLIVDDCSPERLASLLASEGQGGVAVMSPEGDVFEIMSAKYNSGVPNLGVYLKGHAGDSIRVDRVGRAPELIRRPALTMVLAIQPEVVHGLVERPGFRGRAARTLPLLVADQHRRQP